MFYSSSYVQCKHLRRYRRHMFYYPHHAKKKPREQKKPRRVSIISFRSGLILSDTEQFYPMIYRELHQHNCATDQRLLQVGNTNSFRTNTRLLFLPLRTGRRDRQNAAFVAAERQSSSSATASSSHTTPYQQTTQLFPGC